MAVACAMKSFLKVFAGSFAIAYSRLAKSGLFYEAKGAFGMSNENDVASQESTQEPQQEQNLSPEPIEDVESENAAGSDKAMRALASLMPWLISLLFHIGLFLILVFVVFFTSTAPDPEDIIIPNEFISENPGGRMSPNPSKVKSHTTQKQTRKKRTRQKTKVTTDTGVSKNALSVIGTAGSSAASGGSDMGLKTTGGGSMGNGFFGLGGNAHNVVYVIDGSGSMMVSGAFEAVREEMYRSIYKLTDKQTFAIILYTAGKPVECSKRLMRVNKRNKIKAAKFLGGYNGEGASNPIPALKRAFAYLKRAKKPGRLIYLLSDGEFRGEGVNNAVVLSTVRSLNADKKVFINTLLFGTKQPEAIKVMEQIANQNKGSFKYIEWGE